MKTCKCEKANKTTTAAKTRRAYRSRKLHHGKGRKHTRLAKYGFIASPFPAYIFALIQFPCHTKGTEFFSRLHPGKNNKESCRLPQPILPPLPIPDCFLFPQEEGYFFPPPSSVTAEEGEKKRERERERRAQL